MDRNTTLAFILITGIIILWLFINTPSPEKPPVKPKSTKELKDTSVAEKKKPIQVPQIERDSLKLGKFFTAVDKKEEIITVETDLAIIELSSKGGNIRKYYLKKFDNWYSADKKDKGSIYTSKVQLILREKDLQENSYNISFVSSDGRAINTADLHFNPSTSRSKFLLTKDDSATIEYAYKTENGGIINKKYQFYSNKYHIDSDIEMTNMNNIISNNAYDIVWNNGIRFVEENSVDEANYAMANVYYGDEVVNVDASGEENLKKEFNGRVDWLGIRNKYFAAIIAPDNPSIVEGAYINGRSRHYPNSGVNEYYDVRLTIPFKDLKYQKHSFTLYIGPVDYDILVQYGKKLEAIVNFGSFFGLKFIVRPIAEYILLPLFNFLHTFIPNYGFVIIVFSLIIKIVLYPLTKSSFQSMKKMQMLQPKIVEIREKFKDDPQKMNKETMKLYSTYGINPAGGCLPLLLQMPIFVALWGLFQAAIELRQQPFAFWITDLSRPDIIYDLSFKLPLFGIDKVSGLALLMGITTFIQQKMSVKDPKQQMLVYVMPVMLTIMFMSFPSGLNLYYFMFNIFSIAQQYYINHKHSDMVLEPVKGTKKSKGFMQKMMEAAEQSAKTQQKRRH
jgi:YidC/Oxa1 family membrane protein insertase